jgi:hypothetical protein
MAELSDWLIESNTSKNITTYLNKKRNPHRNVGVFNLKSWGNIIKLGSSFEYQEHLHLKKFS